jgi:hypothetical protein
MITSDDLREAIAECEGQRNPSSDTCVKLAAFKYLLEKKEKPERIQITPRYSYASKPPEYDSGTEFSDLIKGKEYEKILPLIDELVTAVSAYNPRLYQAFLRKLR